MKITFQNPPKEVDEKLLYNILRDYKILNCEVLVRDENGKCNEPSCRAHTNPSKSRSMTLLT